MLRRQPEFIISGWPPLISSHKFDGTKKSWVIQQLLLAHATDRTTNSARRSLLLALSRAGQQVRCNNKVLFHSVRQSFSSRFVNGLQNLSVLHNT